MADGQLAAGTEDPGDSGQDAGGRGSGPAGDAVYDRLPGLRRAPVPVLQPGGLPEEPAILRWTGVSHASGTIGVEGSAQTVVEAEFRNTSGGTIDSVHLAAGGSWLDLDDLGLGNGETLVIDHEDTGSRCVLRIRIGNRSVLGCRTGSDDLFVNPGSNGVSLSADGSGVLTFRCAGRYL